MSKFVPIPGVCSTTRHPLLPVVSFPASALQPGLNASGLNHIEMLNGPPVLGSTREFSLFNHAREMESPENCRAPAPNLPAPQVVPVVKKAADPPLQSSD